MKKIICDRCGREIKKSDGVYHVFLSAGSCSTNVYAAEVTFNLNKIFKKEKDYCIDCIKEIEEFLSKGKG